MKAYTKKSIRRLFWSRLATPTLPIPTSIWMLCWSSLAVPTLSKTSTHVTMSQNNKMTEQHCSLSLQACYRLQQSWPCFALCDGHPFWAMRGVLPNLSAASLKNLDGKAEEAENDNRQVEHVPCDVRVIPRFLIKSQNKAL